MSKKNNNQKSSGILSGILLLLIGIGVLWYNEGRTVANQSTVNEAKKNYIDVTSKEIDKKNEGKLIATKGKIDLSEANELNDSKFGIKVKAAKLLRNVEMYQWQEECETDDNDKQTCKYKKVWESQIIDSSEFEESGHENPDMIPYESEIYIAENVRLGAFTLPEDLIDKLSYNKNKKNEELEAEYNNSVETIKVEGKYLTNVQDNTPQIGDIRISYQYLDEENISVMAVQTDNTFEAYTSKKGKDIYKIMKGNYTGTQMLEKMSKTNKTLKWVLRVIGILLIISAFESMFNLVNTIASKIPIIGNIITASTKLISTILGLSVSLIVIAIAWFRFRPVLSIILILIVVALIIGLRKYLTILKKERK